MIQYDFTLPRLLKLFRNTAFLTFFSFLLAGAGIVIASNYGPDGGKGQDDDGPCCEETDERCCKEGEEICPASTDDPIILKRGSVKETTTDLSIPGPLGGWKHSRSYDSMLDTRTSSNPMYNIQGRRWTGGPQKMYLRKTGSKMELFLSSSNKRTFTDDNPGKANGTFSGPTDLDVTLTKSVSVDYANYTGSTDENEVPTNEIPLGYIVYTLTFTKSGKVYIFRAKDPTDPCWGITGSQNSIIPLSERTNLTYLTQGLHGETYYYNANGRLGLVVTADPQAYFIKYSYYISGNNSGKIRLIEVYDGAPDLDETSKIAEAEYKYVDYSGISSNVGYLGELAQIRVSELLTDGVSWDHKYTQYRYYHSRQGGEYQLKSVFEPDAIERIMENNAEITTPELLFNRADTSNMSGGKNLLQYASRTFSYYNGNTYTNSNIYTAWGSENLRSKYGGNDRNEEYSQYPHINLVKSETVNTGCSSCGGSTTGGRTMDYYYMTLNSVPSNDASGNSNIVVYLTVVDTKDSAGTPMYRTIYGLNWHGIELRRAKIENPNAATLNVVCTSKKLDANGKVTEERPEEAHTLVNTNAKLMQFLNPYNGSSWANDLATLEPSKGIIRVYEYDTASKQKSGTKVKIGSGGTEYYISATDYNAQGQVAAEYVYPTQTTSREASDRITATYSYTYWDNSNQAIKVKTETKQAVPVSQNGSGIPAVSKVFYDSYGKVRWTQDALGVVTYQGYHPLNLQQTLTVRDVDTGSLPAIMTADSDNIAAWTGAAPFQRNNALASAFNMVSTREYDLQGRVYASTGPDGVTSYTIRDARRTMQFPAWDTSTQQPILPISVTEVNVAGKPVSVYQLPPTAVVVSEGKPTGVQLTATKNTWTRQHYGTGGSLEHVDRYHSIPASGFGSLGTHYYRTANIHDQQGRQVAMAQYGEDGKWQVSYIVLDWRDRQTEQRQGVNASVPSYANLNSAAWLKTVAKTIYAGGKAERSLSYFNTGNADYIGTIYKYDEWNRVRAAVPYAVSGASETAFGPYSVQDFDWRGNVMATAQFEAEPNWSIVVGAEHYAASTATDRLTLTKNSHDIFGRTWKTEVRDNVAADFIAMTYQYDLAGRAIVVANDDQSQETDYDALGRQVEARSKNFNILVSLTNTEYDASGRMTGQHSLILKPGNDSGVNINGNNFVRNTQYFWYDNAGRQIVQGNYGSGGAIWDHFAKPARPASVPTESSASCLVTKTNYSVLNGRVESTVDPKGVVNKTNSDALGRTTATIANFVQNGTSNDENVEVQYAYDGLGNLLTLTALNPTTGNQATRYLYEDAYNASLQTSAIYPDSADANSNGTDQVKTEYDLAGNITQVTDQNGTVRVFLYDAQRRLIGDQVTTLGNNVDGTVRKIARGYNSFGAMETISSLDAQNAVLNEVKYEYDANQKLKKLYQSHAGSVIATTPYLEYEYDAANKSRLSDVVYPSGKTLTYNYDNFERIESISEGQSPVVSYVYDGSGNPMQTTYNEPGLSLAYTNGGLDRFGRIVNHAWMKGAEANVHILHGYDFAGNRTFRHDAVHAANSELYAYDQMNQIKALNRGVLNQSNDAVAIPNHTETWNFDKTGNWMQYEKNGTVENRTHNAANEIQEIVTHDANGNMILMSGLRAKYDAWNRLIEVRNTEDVLIANYAYNGFNQRIKKTVNNIVAKSFFNENWQELESQTDSKLTVYVWGLRYIDDLIYREKSEERLYSLADLNWNVIAVADASGSVVERMKYDAFGKLTWLGTDFALRNESQYAWNRTFTSQIFDTETGLTLYRNRYYHAGLGRFISRDPIGFASQETSLYVYASNNPVNKVDKLGHQTSDPRDHDCNCNCDHWSHSTDCYQCARSRGGTCNECMDPPHTENFYVCMRHVRGEECTDDLARACNWFHTDIYGDKSGEVYVGWGGGVANPNGNGLPSGEGWKCIPLTRATYTLTVPPLIPHGTIVIPRRIELTMKWGAAKGKSCKDVTDADILACLKAKKPSKKPGESSGLNRNCQTDCYQSAADCCLTGFLPSTINPVTVSTTPH